MKTKQFGLLKKLGGALPEDIGSIVTPSPGTKDYVRVLSDTRASYYAYRSTPLTVKKNL